MDGANAARGPVGPAGPSLHLRLRRSSLLPLDLRPLWRRAVPGLLVTAALHHLLRRQRAARLAVLPRPRAHPGVWRGHPAAADAHRAQLGDQATPVRLGSRMDKCDHGRDVECDAQPEPDVGGRHRLGHGHGAPIGAVLLPAHESRRRAGRRQAGRQPGSRAGAGPGCRTSTRHRRRRRRAHRVHPGACGEPRRAASAQHGRRLLGGRARARVRRVQVARAPPRRRGDSPGLCWPRRV
mmetsp:Transcript_7547/g.24792  ORF Transcript_7547/g.24792 Transcript_7547/m.24792 type:complete len:238 (-) Transcript_7547:165-878(-)